MVVLRLRQVDDHPEEDRAAGGDEARSAAPGRRDRSIRPLGRTRCGRHRRLRRRPDGGPRRSAPAVTGLVRRPRRRRTVGSSSWGPGHRGEAIGRGDPITSARSVAESGLRTEAPGRGRRCRPGGITQYVAGPAIEPMPAVRGRPARLRRRPPAPRSPISRWWTRPVRPPSHRRNGVRAAPDGRRPGGGRAGLPRSARTSGGPAAALVGRPAPPSRSTKSAVAAPRSATAWVTRRARRADGPGPVPSPPSVGRVVVGWGTAPRVGASAIWTTTPAACFGWMKASIHSGSLQVDADGLEPGPSGLLEGRRPARGP